MYVRRNRAMPGRQQKITFAEKRQLAVFLVYCADYGCSSIAAAAVTGGCHPANRAGARAPTHKMPVAYLRYAT